MDAAICHVLSMGFERVILTGTDLPMMGRRHLESGFSALDLSDVVTGPHARRRLLSGGGKGSLYRCF